MDSLDNYTFLSPFHFPTKTKRILSLMQHNEEQKMRIRSAIDALSVHLSSSCFYKEWLEMYFSQT